jgi:hypothetical protein
MEALWTLWLIVRCARNPTFGIFVGRSAICQDSEGRSLRVADRVVGGDRDSRVSRLINGTQGRRAQELTMTESV